VEEVAAELAIGDRLQAQVLLPLHQFGDGLVLGGAQIGLGNVVCLAVLAGFDHLARAQERTDMVGAAWQFGSHREIVLS
jgi:hypothetical protein